MNASRISFFLTLLLATSISALANSLSDVQAAMKERQPAIQQLWAAGKIGENNQGFVEARQELAADEEKLLKAENEDRRVVYRVIARSTQSTPQQVGVQRAAQISQRAAQGLWLQDAEGKWYRK